MIQLTIEQAVRILASLQKCEQFVRVIGLDSEIVRPVGEEARQVISELKAAIVAATN